MNRSAIWLIVFAATAAHASALWAGFIWLDHAHIEQGLALAPAGEWLSLFSHGFAGTGFYRPLMATSLSLDASLRGAPWLYHATSLAFHAAAAVLTLLAGLALGLIRRAATLAALLFVVHPATSLVANAIAFRSEAMITVALLSLVVLHRRGNVLGAALAMLLGALSKETALVLGPLFVVALELFPELGEAPQRPRNFRLLAAECAASFVALGLRFQFAPAWRATFAPLSFGHALGVTRKEQCTTDLAVRSDRLRRLPGHVLVAPASAAWSRFARWSALLCVPPPWTRAAAVPRDAARTRARSDHALVVAPLSLSRSFARDHAGGRNLGTLGAVGLAFGRRGGGRTRGDLARRRLELSGRSDLLVARGRPNTRLS